MRSSIATIARKCLLNGVFARREHPRKSARRPLGSGRACLIATAILAGNLCLSLFPRLPSTVVVVCLFVAATAMGAAIARWVPIRAAPRCGVWLLFAGLSFVWTWSVAQKHAAQILAFEAEGKKIGMQARVIDLPVLRADGGVRFDATPLGEGVVKQNAARQSSKNKNSAKQNIVLPQTLRLRFSPLWVRDEAAERQPIQHGDVLSITAKLKRPSSFSNAGGFDYEKYLFSRNIGGTGYVLDYAHIESRPHWRQALFNRLLKITEGHSSAGAIIALSMGAHTSLDEPHKKLLIDTGTRHLFAVSGLHIGMVFVSVFFIAAWLWRAALLFRCAAIARFSRRNFASLFALAAATAYAALAGFSLPAQRALLMLACVCAVGGLRLRARPSDVLAFALAVVLVVQPLSVLSVSFWFSFVATAVIVGVVYGRALRKTKRLWLIVQLALFPVMLSLSMVVFQHGALNAPVSNLVAIPLVSFAILPVCLLTVVTALVHAPLAEMFSVGADYLFAGMWTILEWTSSLSDGATIHSPRWWSLFAMFIGLSVFAVAHSGAIKASALIFFLPLWFASPPHALKQGEFEITFLDVGQGLAAVIRTRDTTTLYDTAASYATGSVADSVIAPYLRHHGIEHIDHLIVSHGDNDHAGGIRDILRAFTTTRRTASQGVANEYGFDECLAEQKWVADGVEFAFVHPPPNWPDKGRNNASCVLRVGAHGHCALLTADIERAAERALLSRYADQIHCPVMLVPHHGSLTSSSPRLLDAVGMRLGVVVVSRRNRYGFPKSEVIDRYTQRGVEILNTAQTGGLNIRFEPAKQACVSGAHRIDERGYWHAAEAGEAIRSRCR